MVRQKKARRYVLFGCPIDINKRYDIKGYIGKLPKNGHVGLVPKKADAFVYVDDKKPGHGSPEDWVKLFNEDYGLNVHPIFLKI